jgi:hypothetical protein
MRNTVAFQYPGPLAVVSAEEGILSVDGAGWFVHVLRTIPGLDLDEVIQEDWAWRSVPAAPGVGTGSA